MNRMQAALHTAKKLQNKYQYTPDHVLSTFGKFRNFFLQDNGQCPCKILIHKGRYQVVRNTGDQVLQLTPVLGADDMVSTLSAMIRILTNPPKKAAKVPPTILQQDRSMLTEEWQAKWDKANKEWQAELGKDA